MRFRKCFVKKFNSCLWILDLRNHVKLFVLLHNYILFREIKNIEHSTIQQLQLLHYTWNTFSRPDCSFECRDSLWWTFADSSEIFRRIYCHKKFYSNNLLIERIWKRVECCRSHVITVSQSHDYEIWSNLHNRAPRKYIDSRACRSSSIKN